MTEKTEWEVIDEEAPAAARPTAAQLLREALGPYWRWKLAGFFILTAITLAILVAFVGVVVLVLTAVAIVLFVVTRIRRWLRYRTGAQLPKKPEQ